MGDCLPTLSETAVSALHRGDKIAAIKAVRRETSLGLSEAKALVVGLVVFFVSRK